MKKSILIGFAGLALLAQPALAQSMMSAGKPGNAMSSGNMMSSNSMMSSNKAPALTRIAAVISGVNGDELDVTGADGSKTAVMLTDKTRITYSVPITIDQIKPGSYIGAGSQADASNNLKAVEITVFPESARGAGEGHRTWDEGPNSRMTNGTVSQVVGTNGRSLTITYNGGQQVVNVDPSTPIVTFAAADRSALVAGAHVSVRGMKTPDGKFVASVIQVGKDGSVPPV